MYRPCFLLLLASLVLNAQSLGIFENHSNIGDASGSVELDSTGRFHITGKGANIWANADAFHYVWKKTSGDIVLSALSDFVGKGKNPHRKVVLMVRQSLEPGSPYADIAIHGDGMISLQYRTLANEQTREVKSLATAAPGIPTSVRLERHGDVFNMVVLKPGQPPAEPPNPTTVVLKDPVYVGIGITSHETDTSESATVSNVEISATPRTTIYSHITIYDVRSKRSHVIHSAKGVWEAPNWSPDGKFLLVNSRGVLNKIDPDGKGEPEPITLSEKIACNNDHGITPDGKHLAISGRGTGTGSQVFTADIDGSNTKLVASAVPSYFHGFSPDGKYFAFAGQRDNNFDLYRMPFDGGPEQRLTSNAAYDDGPDYSPDGKWIYFNSERTGHMQVWRIPAAGDDSKAEQVVQDETSDWFPHPSPNGKLMVMISFPKGTVGHPPNRQVILRMMRMPGDKLKKDVQPEPVVTLFGGQGTLNVNSWSPDSKKFAFVAYERVIEQ